MDITQLTDEVYEFVIPNNEIYYANEASYYKVKMTREELMGLYHQLREHIIYN